MDYLPHLVSTRRKISGDVRKVARAFAQEMRDEIDDVETMDDINAANAEYAMQGLSCCCSQEHRDANMVMDAAFTKAMGREFDLESDTDVALWNEAWDYARLVHFRPELIRDGD